MSAAEVASRVIDAVEKVVIGKRDRIELVVTSLLARGHVLVTDVPGTGKTVLVRSLAAAVGLEFKRIQCTPDLLPNDITGVNVFDPRDAAFRFRPGPVFANLVLADEINRATPRTQAALLEAMQERQVTVDGETRLLGDPFMVIATQNPIEFEGTFPLPEAQLDRFLMSIAIGYPAERDELGLIRSEGGWNALAGLAPAVSHEALRQAVGEVDQVHLDLEVAGYLLGIVAATRSHPATALGASPRAGIALGAAARARAAIAGRDFVIPDDVKQLAPEVLAHRLVLTPDARLHGRTARDVIREILGTRAVEAETG